MEGIEYCYILVFFFYKISLDMVYLNLADFIATIRCVMGSNDLTFKNGKYVSYENS